MGNRDKIWIISGILLFVVMVGVALWIKSRPREVEVKLPFPTWCDKEQKLDGVIFCSKHGVSDAFMQTAVQSLDKLNEDLQRVGYQRFDKTGFVVFIKHDCVDRNGTPAWLIRADDYDGTVFDQDPTPGVGKIYAAEYVITGPFGAVADMEIVCLLDNPVYIRNAVRYGKEHIELFKQDREKFYQTVNHGSGVYHPLIPEN